MRVIKIKYPAIIAIVLVSILCITCQQNEMIKVDDDVTQYVNPFIGTSGFVSWIPGDSVSNEDVNRHPRHEPFGGLVFPGAALPFGMIQLSPDCNTSALGWSAGYIYSDSSLLGFSHMHTSGNGMSFGHLLFLPLVANPDTISDLNSFILQTHRASFSHSNETASPGYYQVKLINNDINVELTATQRVGIQRYQFPEKGEACVLLDLIHGLNAWGEVENATISVINDSTIIGSRTIKSGITTWYAVHLSRSFKNVFISADSVISKNQTSGSGKKLKVLLSFDKQDNFITVKTGISFTSKENAENNILKEAPGFDFESYRTNAKQKWNSQLSKIRIEKGKRDDVVKFYTALYHSNLTPMLFCDADSSFLGADGKVHSNANFVNYTFFTFWDTYRTLHPLHTIIQPKNVNDYINSMLVQASYSKDSLLPSWCVAGMNWPSMAGLSSAPVIAEAYAKGFRGFDVQKAFHFLTQNVNSGMYAGYGAYCKFGYVPYDLVKMNVPKTLEYANSDWNIGTLGKLAGIESDEYFQRATNYRNLYDSTSGFFRPKNTKGEWRAPFDPRAVSHQFVSHDFMESNAWQYAWHVLQNPNDLVNLMGGNEKFTIKLDSMFDQPSVLTGAWAADVAGLIGQYAQGNQPDHHAPYLYCFAGKPWKTQQRVNQIINTSYSSKPDGLPGNDDGGEMSAWLVFSYLGFYPVNPASCMYVIGSPRFSKTSINLPENKTFIVTAKNVSDKKIFIQSATLNGKPFNRAWIMHKEIMDGGELVFEMGELPNKEWAKDGISGE